MPLRFPSPRRVRQPAGAAFAIAMSFLAAPSHGQDAPRPPPALLALRDGDGGLVSGTSPLADAAAGNSPLEASATADADKGKPSKKQAPRKTARLPDLQPYRKAQRAGLPGGPPAFNPARRPPPTVAALPDRKSVV